MARDYWGWLLRATKCFLSTETKCEALSGLSIHPACSLFVKKESAFFYFSLPTRKRAWCGYRLCIHLAAMYTYWLHHAECSCTCTIVVYSTFSENSKAMVRNTAHIFVLIRSPTISQHQSIVIQYEVIADTYSLHGRFNPLPL